MVAVARSVGVAVLAVLMAVALALASTITSAVQLLASTALIMSGTFTPTPPPAFVDMAKNHFILPTHPGEDIGPYVAVTTPEEAWPVTGLFDLPFGRSVAIGLGDLQQAMAEHGNDNLVIFGHSQSSVIIYLEKRRLAEQFPIGTPAPNIDFVTIGTLNLPNGGVMTRFWGLYLPFVDFYFNGPAPTDTQFDTVIITQRWDGFADFPIYPIVLPSVLNAIAGFFYVHEEYENVTLAGDPSKYLVGSHGDTDYYFFETENLPLFGPLRGLGVPESLTDIVEPLTAFVVELGYRRDIPPWVPSPARLIPIHDPLKVLGDFVDALDETIDNTAEFLGRPPPPAIPAPVTTVATTTAVADQQALIHEPPEPAIAEQVAQAELPDSATELKVATGRKAAPAGTRKAATDDEATDTQLVATSPSTSRTRKAGDLAKADSATEAMRQRADGPASATAGDTPSTNGSSGGDDNS